MKFKITGRIGGWPVDLLAEPFEDLEPEQAPATPDKLPAYVRSLDPIMWHRIESTSTADGVTPLSYESACGWVYPPTNEVRPSGGLLGTRTPLCRLCFPDGGPSAASVGLSQPLLAPPEGGSRSPDVDHVPESLIDEANLWAFWDGFHRVRNLVHRELTTWCDLTLSDAALTQEPKRISDSKCARCEQRFHVVTPT